MKGSIALGWLLATVLFALLDNALLTVAFFVFAVFFSFITMSNDFETTKMRTIRQMFEKGEFDED